MTRFLKYFIALVFTGYGGCALSQNEAKKWYFGNYGALDFTTKPPTNLANGAMTTWEGCASIADGSGNLLFYTNGIKVWNQAHVVMANGTGLFGENSSSQSALIVKQPGSATIYFIFTTDGGASGLRYSVVDMSLAGGLGAVTTKNVLVYGPSTERLCGAKHCNGIDIWVISHEASSNVFRAYLVTAGGVSNTAVNSAIGSGMGGINSIGCMKVSPNGKKLGTSFYVPASFELYDFDNATGVISNPLSLPVSSPGYGCEFSPDGSKFYGVLAAPGNVTNRLRQWDLCSGSNQAIIASETSFNATHTGQLQLAPDGKIYQARAAIKKQKLSPEVSIELMYGESALGVIHNPNASAAAVNFNNTGQAVNPALSMYGLPNFVSGFYKTPVAPFSYSTNPAVSCVKAFFAAPPLINNTCSATSYSISSVKWLFGDPASGASDTSLLVNPDHAYPGNGTYKARLILYNACGGVIDTLKQQVIIGRALANNAADFSICSGQSLTLAAAGPGTYSWSTGATASSIVVSPTANTTYSLGYTDAFGCPRESIQIITVNPMPVLTLLAKDTVCEGSTAALKASGAITYSWSTGATNSSISVTPPGTTSYTVTGTSIDGCSASKTQTIVVNPSPIPVITTGNTVVCAGSTVTAFASGITPATYYWSNGSTSPTLIAVPTDQLFIYSVKATYPGGCWRYQTVRFNVKALPLVNIMGTNTVCAGSVATQTAIGAVTYTWSKGITTNPAYMAPLKNTTYTVTGTGVTGCKATATVVIKVRPSSILSAAVSGNVTICDGERTFLSATGGNQYDWSPATALVESGNNGVVVSPSVSTVYSVHVSMDNTCGITKTVIVSVKPKPKLSAGRDTIFNLKDQVFINASGTGTISWTGGEGIFCPDCPSTQVFPTQSGCYWAQAINDYGCIATDEVCLEIGTEYAVYLPNTFTPDGDGLNEEFFVRGFGISDLHLTIYDRWGQKLFTANNENDGWDGTYRGRPCQAGIYTWVLEYVSANGRHQQKTGHITLLR